MLPPALVRLCATGMVAAAFAAPAQASDIQAGKMTAASCAMCHGVNGLSQMPGAPNLAGQSAMYTSEQLKNFRSGKRQNEIMNVIAKPLTDTDIGNLAAWYESIKVEVIAR